MNHISEETKNSRLFYWLLYGILFVNVYLLMFILTYNCIGNKWFQIFTCFEKTHSLVQTNTNTMHKSSRVVFSLVVSLFVLSNNALIAQDEEYYQEDMRITLFGKTLANEPEEQFTKRTKLKYDNFDLVIHDFNAFGSERPEFCEDCDWQFFPSYDEFENENDPGVEGWFLEDSTGVNLVELCLRVTKDTLHLAEDFGHEGESDNQLYNTLIQIIPKYKEDTYKISMCYETLLYETLDQKGYIEKENNGTIESFYENHERHREYTTYIPLEEKHKGFFLALPHLPELIETRLVDGVPINYDVNYEKQLEQEQKTNDAELKRIKKKYNLTDTLIHVPGEYDTYITLNRGKQLFGYTYENYLFKIERMQGNVRKETKYISVNILSGC